MASLADTLWHEFAVETEEHLQAVEPILAQAGLAPSDPADIGQLFRSFHSVKGLARAMDMLGMEGVAHHAENLLGVVRDGRAALTPELTELLLQAVDALKQMRAHVVADRSDTPPDPALLARLATAFVAIEGGGSVASVAATTALAPADALPTGVPAAGVPLHEDPDMLAIFVEMMKARGPELCGALSAVATERADAADAAETLAHAAEVMAFEALSESFAGILDTMRAQDAEGGAGAPRREALVAQLGEIRLQIELVGEITGQDAGHAEFAAALAERVSQDRTRLAMDIAALLEQLRTDVDDDDRLALEADAGAVARSARLLHGVAASQSFDQMATLVLLIEDLYGRVAAGDIAVSDTLLDATEGVIAEIGTGTEDLSAEAAAALTAGLRGPLADQAGGDAQGGLIAGVQVPAELGAVLSADNVAALEQGLAAGLVPYHLLINFEADPATAERLVGWLTGKAQAITNRTVIRGSESWFEFLALSSSPPAAAAAELLALDPERRCLKEVRRLSAAPGGSPVIDAGGIAAPASAAAPAPEAAVEPRRGSAAANVIRVRSEAIDGFLDEIGEMRVAIGALTHAARGDGAAATVLSRARQAAARLPPALRGELQSLLQEMAQRERRLLDAEERLSGIVARVHQSALEFRVVPVETVFNRFPRVVRDLAQRQGKAVQLALEGRDVRIDKSMVEALVDPLMHMVRNAVDHGIELPAERAAAAKPERARLTLRAAQRGSEIAIEIEDDGRGLDADAIRAKAVERGLVPAAQAAALDDAQVFRFIFSAGLSTAAAITETSGRGVGMDVVLTTVRRLNGDITIRSARGAGTVFTLTLPVSAALQTALIVRAAGQTLAVPERYVMSVTEIKPDTIHRVGAGRAIAYRDGILPLYDLAALLGLADGVAAASPAAQPVLVIGNGHDMIGIAVGAIEQRQELFLRELHPLLTQFPGLGGASALGDGRVVLVLDGDEILQLAARGIAAPPGLDDRQEAS